MKTDALKNYFNNKNQKKTVPILPGMKHIWATKYNNDKRLDTVT